MLGVIMVPVAIVSIIGLVLALILVVASKFMAVPVDETFDKVRAELPGVNCGACGYAGCDAYANALIGGGVKANLCIPGADAVSLKLSEALGLPFEDVVEKYDVVHCSGAIDVAEYVMDYAGPQTCEACNSFFQGRRSCSHACLGYGDCISVCQYDAIHVVNGLAVIDPLKCTGCGMCAKKCPNFLISVRSTTAKVFVGCSSTDKGAYVRKVCKAGCIGCKICEKACQFGAISVDNNLATIDPEKCTNCMACVEKCPRKVIKVICQNGQIV